jgi:transcriptional regulator with XRE-family HTH domain
MPAYVRVRKHDDLVAAIQRRGTQTDIAALAGISLSRLSQLYTGRHDVIAVDKAGALEDVLDVPRGSLFQFAESYDRIAPYVDLDSDPDPEPDESDDDTDDSEETDDEHDSEPPAAAETDPVQLARHVIKSAA